MRNQNSPIRATNIWDFLIILIALVAICFLTYLLTQRYTSATDSATMAGVVFPSITAIAAAAFGISQAVKARVAENVATQAIADKSDVQDKLDEDNEVVNQLIPECKALRLEVEDPFRAMETMWSSQTGERGYQHKVSDLLVSDKYPGSSIFVDTKSLVTPRERLVRIETLLESIKRRR